MAHATDSHVENQLQFSFHHFRFELQTLRFIQSPTAIRLFVCSVTQGHGETEVHSTHE